MKCKETTQRETDICALRNDIHYSHCESDYKITAVLAVIGGWGIFSYKGIDLYGGELDF